MAVLMKLAAAVLAASPALAQFVSPPTDLIKKQGYAGIDVRYKQVPPGICELSPYVKSYSGYADVAKDEHVFFWFFEARKVDPSKAPLTVWINGGPGSTSMYGLFQELGPCGVDKSGKPFNNPYSWSEVSNMIFIDQPVTTGFSYSKAVPAIINTTTEEITPLPSAKCPANATAGTCGTFSTPNKSLTANSTAAAAPNFWKALQGFMGAFPQYTNGGFHFGTESYGGHYGPVFSSYIQDQNKNLPKGAKEIPLQSLMVGNGWFDPKVQYPAFYNFTVFPGNTYDFKPYNASREKELYQKMFGPRGCTEQLEQCRRTGKNKDCVTADAFCADLEGYLDEAGRDEYDIRELTPDPFPPSYFESYLNTPKVLKAIGAYTNFSDFSATVGDAFGSTGDDAREDGTVEDMRRLVDDGIYVVQYTGDADYNCNWLGGQVIAEHIDAPGFNTAAGFANISTSDRVVHGQVKQSRNYGFLRVYLSGHLVPFYQPLLALEFFNRTINGLDIQTGTQKVAGRRADPRYYTKGSKYSTYREGISTVQFKVLPADATYNTTTGAPNPT